MSIKNLILFSLALMSCSTVAQNDEPEFAEPVRLLVFSKTAGYRHASLSSGIKMLFDLSQPQNWLVTATEDASVFQEGSLNRFDVIVMMNPSGDALNDSQQAAFEKFMKRGKGFVGVHSATDFEYDWPFYGALIGAWFKTHPPAQTAAVVFEDLNHPAMKPFEGMSSYTTFDEWYSFRENPRQDVNVLATLDEGSIKKYDNDEWKMGDHPIIWWSEKNGMRSFYSGFGHTHEAFQDDKIREHIKNAINWAARRTN